MLTSRRSTGEKGVGKSGKALHFKNSIFHRVITGFVRVAPHFPCTALTASVCDETDGPGW